jgi:hypothetical protein
MSALAPTTTTAYLHRVDSSSPRVIIVRQSSFKVQPTRSINAHSNPQQPSTMVTSVSTQKKQRKALFK